MINETDIRILNEMATIDREPPFEQGDDSPAISESDEGTTSVDFDTVTARDVFTVTKAWRQDLRLPEETSGASQRMKALIHNYEAVSNDEPSHDSQAPSFAGHSLFDRVRKILPSFGYPAAGLATACSLALLLMISQDSPNPSWEARYQKLSVGEIVEAYTIQASTQFFLKSASKVRGQSVAPRESCGKTGSADGSAGCGLANAESERALLVQGIADSLFEPVLRATELQGLRAARVPEQGLWFLIRATTTGGDSETENSAETCKLVEAIFSSSDMPPVDESGYLLSYCPSNWAQKLEVL